MRVLLHEMYDWDHFTVAADGRFWRERIASVLGLDPKQPSAPTQTDSRLVEDLHKSLIWFKEQDAKWRTECIRLRDALTEVRGAGTLGSAYLIAKDALSESAPTESQPHMRAEPHEVPEFPAQAPAVSDKDAEIARLHYILREPYKCTNCGARTDHQWGRSCPGTATTCHWTIDTSYTRSDVSRPDKQGSEDV